MSRMTKIRVDLKPYIKHLIDEAITYGYPLQRALFLHYEDDSLAYDLQYQYLFGKDILIKPVIEPNQLITSVYLPKDEWVHLWTGINYQGGTEVIVDCPIGYPPVFYKKDSLFSDLFSLITNKYT
jgi:alpha-glucosidase